MCIKCQQFPMLQENSYKNWPHILRCPACEDYEIERVDGEIPVIPHSPLDSAFINAKKHGRWHSLDLTHMKCESCGAVNPMEEILDFNSVWMEEELTKVGKDGYVKRTAEKEVISNHSHAGLYHFARGSDFVRLGREMVRRNIRVKNEFYIAPLYNLFIEEGMKINVHPIDNLWSMGTPSERRHFLEHEYADLQHK